MEQQALFQYKKISLHRNDQFNKKEKVLITFKAATLFVHDKLFKQEHNIASHIKHKKY